MKTAKITALLLVLALPASRPALAQRFRQTNLVSDIAGNALRTDANLVNPWGLAPSGGGVFWVSNNGTGTSTLYNPDGTIRPLIVTIPGGGPSGVVATAASDSAFDIPNGATTARAAFIFVSLGGTISAWSPVVNMTNAIQVASDPKAIYTGAALGGIPTDPLLYVTNFLGGEIEAYDSSFAERKLAGSFTDPNLPTGYFPFNIANVGGQLYVAYAQQSSPGEEFPGPGLGIVNVFDFQGNFVRRFTTGGALNAPWAVVRAPANFGAFASDLLVGNFGDGRILAYDSGSGAFKGALLDTLGSEVKVEGVWGLAFGRAASGPEVARRLYFAAGIEDETHGLFGFLAVADTTVTPPVASCDNESKGQGFWKQQCGGPLNGHDHGDGDGDEHSGFSQFGKAGHDGDDGDDDDQGDDDHDGHGPSGVHPDSLDVLFACIANDAAPNAFGVDGCFTAGCDLVRKVGKRSEDERAAQVLLLTRLNLCSGAVCDSFPITCEDDQDGATVLTVGDVADSLDVLLCESGNSSDIKHLVGLLRCVLDSEDGDDQGEDEDDDARGQTIAVNMVSGNPTRLGDGPVHFAVNATSPAMVQMRIYDVRGRLIAEPLRSSMVVGSANVTWDGTDLRGKTVAPGTYFYRAITAKEAASGRLLIVR